MSLTLACVCVSGALGQESPAPATAPKSSGSDYFIDPEDGAVDMAGFLLSRTGFMPVPIIITEPAVGAGGGLSLAFLHYPENKSPAQRIAEARAAGLPIPRFAPPSISALAGGGTENGTWFGGLVHYGVWRDDQTRYLGILLRAHAVLEYYGNGGGDVGLQYESDVWFLKQQVEERIKQSNWFYGAHYTYIGTETVFDQGNASVPALHPTEFDSATGGAGGIISYDSRDNTFTPSRGARAQLVFSYYDDAFGGDYSYLRTDFFSAMYWTLSPRWVLGWRLESHFTNDGTPPFYHLPQIQLRGVPAVRYQGMQSAVTELELRWAMTKRWSLVGFGGVGRVSADSIGDLADADNVPAGGVGFRYLIARRLGIHVGCDVAKSEEDTGFYITVGSAWNR